MSVGVVLTVENGQVTSLTKTKYCGEKGKSNLALFLLQGKDKNEKIKQKASELVDTYKSQLNPRVYQLAKKEIEKTDDNKKQKPELQEAQTTSPRKKVVKRRRLED